MTTDPRAAILARCDELEKLARAASNWFLHDERAGSRDIDGVVRQQATFVMAGGEAPPTGFHWRADWQGSTPIPLVAAFDPPAVFELVAGAREMVAEHYPTRENSETGNAYCHGCERQPGDCPTLRTTARMIGVVLGV